MSQRWRPLVDTALDQLPKELINDAMIALHPDDEEALDALSGDEHDERYADIVGDYLDAQIGEARILQQLALSDWRSFTQAAADRLGRGLLPWPHVRRGARRIKRAWARRRDERHL